MVHYGFAIDLTRCIGCHACSLACKAEHRIPVGVHRCWVKSVEQGVFPNATRRCFPVLCNQCDQAPCVAICPTGALFRRPDGIVDLDGKACIGCRACMQACPYDQLFIDPGTRTAEKCNFCANRLETGLLPACVSVCPTECRVFGDMNDASSALRRLVDARPVTVRKPEKGTGAKVYYVGADDSVIRPEAAARPFYYKEGQVGHRPAAAPAEVRGAPGAPRVDYDVPHPRPWGGAVVLYLLTKGVSAGVLLVAAALWWLGHRDPLTRIWAPLAAVAGAAVTAGILVADLAQPLRFPTIVTRANWRSWMARGALILGAHGSIAAAWACAGWSGADRAVSWLSVPGAVAAAAAAVFSGPLFSQGAGRDLWDGWDSVPALLFQALVEGSAMCLLVIGAIGVPGVDGVSHAVVRILAGALVAHACTLAVGVVPRRADTRHRQLALAAIRRGPFGRMFWVGAVGAGIAVPAALITAAALGLPQVLLACASALAVVGTCAWHYVWVEAGQSVPLS